MCLPFDIDELREWEQIGLPDLSFDLYRLPYLSMHRIRDWSQLHAELLETIAGKLPDIADSVRFRAVCSGWRSAVTALPAHLPLLLLPSWDLEDESFDFYSLSENKVHTVDLANFQGKHLFGSSTGWFLAFDSTPSASLLNPMTGEEIMLPPLTRISLGCQDSTFSPHFFKGCVASSRSKTDHLVMIYCCTHRVLAFCRVGDKSWTPILADRDLFIDSFVYHKDKFVVLAQSTNTATIIDASTLSQVAVVPFIESRDVYRRQLVESSSGELLMVVWYTGEKFQVFQLDLKRKKLEWTKIAKLQNSMIFFDTPCAFSYRAGDSTGSKGNCIYFVYPLEPNGWPPKKYGLRVFDMEDATVKELPHTWKDHFKTWTRGTWIIPSFV